MASDGGPRDSTISNTGLHGCDGGCVGTVQVGAPGGVRWAVEVHGEQPGVSGVDGAVWAVGVLLIELLRCAQRKRIVDVKVLSESVS